MFLIKSGPTFTAGYQRGQRRLDWVRLTDRWAWPGRLGLVPNMNEVPSPPSLMSHYTEARNDFTEINVELSFGDSWESIAGLALSPRGWD